MCSRASVAPGDQAEPGSLLGIDVVHQLGEAELLEGITREPRVLVGRAVLPLHLHSPRAPDQLICVLGPDRGVALAVQLVHVKPALAELL